MILAGGRAGHLTWRVFRDLREEAPEMYGDDWDALTPEQRHKWVVFSQNLIDRLDQEGQLVDEGPPRAKGF